MRKPLKKVAEVNRSTAIASRFSTAQREKQSCIAVAVAVPGMSPVSDFYIFGFGFGRSLANHLSSSIAGPSCGSGLPYRFSCTGAINASQHDSWKKSAFR